MTHQDITYAITLLKYILAINFTTLLTIKVAVKYLIANFSATMEVF